MENASQAYLAATRASVRQVRAAIGAATVDPQLLTAAEKLQYEGHLRREDANVAILALHQAEVFRTRESSLEAHLPWLDARWAAGACNGAALWRELRDLGFRGSLRVVAEWAARRRRSEQVNVEGLSRVPSARTVARLMTMARDTLSRTQTVTVAVIEAAVPALVQAREITEAFHALICRKQEAALDGCLDRAAASLLAPFARGLARYHLAVRAAISSAWSNAQAGGQINKLKVVNARCMVEVTSTSYRPALSQQAVERHRDCIRALIERRLTHEALRAARAREAEKAFAAEFPRRAGIKGTLLQDVRTTPLRRARYVGLAKTHLQHVLTAAAINLARLAAWLAGETRAETRQSSFVRLMAQPA